MKIELAIDGKTYEAEVEQNSSDELTVKINGRKFTIKSEREHLSLDGDIYQVKTEDVWREGMRAQIQVNDISHDVELKKVEQKAGILKEEEIEKPVKPVKVLRGKGTITPPMPGKVVAVKVKIGDKVRIGDVLLILEAMKMQNEINSTVEGEVKKINVVEGQSVKAGEVLIVIE